MVWTVQDILQRLRLCTHTSAICGNDASSLRDSAEPAVIVESSCSRARSNSRKHPFLGASAPVHLPRGPHSLPVSLSAPEPERTLQAPEGPNKLPPSMVSQPLQLHRLPALSMAPIPPESFTPPATALKRPVSLAPLMPEQAASPARAASPVQVVGLSKRKSAQETGLGYCVKCPCCKHTFTLPPERAGKRGEQVGVTEVGTVPTLGVLHMPGCSAPVDALCALAVPLRSTTPARHEWDIWTATVSGQSGVGDGDMTQQRQAVSAPINMISVQPQVLHALQKYNKATGRSAIRKSVFAESLSRCHADTMQR